MVLVFSKILMGDDQVEKWEDHIDLMVASISENGGRSCINASAVIVPRYGREIAEALGKRLGPIQPMSPQDEAARLSGFANPKMADYIDGAIEQDLSEPGAEDMTALHRTGPRKVVFEGRHLSHSYHRLLRFHGAPSPTGNFYVPTPALSKYPRARCSKK